MRAILVGLAVGLALPASVWVGAGVTVPASQAHTAAKGNFDVIRKRGDGFRNYDMTERTVSRRRVDWPVGILFWDDAEIDKVKDGLNDVGGQDVYDRDEASEMQARLKNNGGAYVWDSDKGRKTSACPGGPGQPASAYHYRIYATPGNDRMFNRVWGYYAFATTHIDYKECPPRSSTAFGWSEKAEGQLASVAGQAYGHDAVRSDHRSFENREPFRRAGNHVWSNDGRATYVKVP